jgi:hypothetical protein
MCLSCLLHRSTTLDSRGFVPKCRPQEVQKAISLLAKAGDGNSFFLNLVRILAELRTSVILICYAADRFPAV